MADVTITASNVLKDSTVLPGNEDKARVAGAAISAGEVYYLDTANSDVAKLSQTDGTELEATAYAMAVNTAEVAAQTLDGVREGLVTIGTHSVAVGTPLFVSNTAGKIAPLADIGTTDYLKIVGVIASATQIYVNFKAPPPYQLP